MRSAALFAALMIMAVPVLCQETMYFEPEEYSSPVDAWGENINPTDRWNLWSKDKDAEIKWTGGKVLQSPQVMEDREKPEDGAPVLHTVLTGVPDGTWTVSIKYGRDLGVSLDGKEWRRLSVTGGRLGQFEVKDGTLEFWVDDRYAQKNGPGFSYYDQITLVPSQPEKNGVSNGGFEFGKSFRGSGWTFWSREEGAGSAELTDEAHGGKKCVKFVHTGERDFALTNSGRLSVKPGEAWIASAWMKCEDTESANLNVVANGGGALLTWSLGSDGVWNTMGWTKVEARADIPPGCDEIYLRVVGSGAGTVWVDDVALEPGQPKPPPPPKMKVSGWATERVVEKLDRGMVAMPVEAGKVYLGWRLLADDPEDVAFNVYRGRGRMLPEKLNGEPLMETTDFVDETAPAGIDTSYWVRAVVNGEEQASSPTVHLEADPEPRAYQSIKLDGDYTFQKVGLADLDGDGRMDYVIKQPLDNIDPYQGYWTPSPETYKLEAYLNDGTFLWRHDMGWAIERGIWYSPYLVYDFDGDGKAEVALKSGEGDPRSEDGRVMTGPEYITLLDGMTGEIKAQADWPQREKIGKGPAGYNYASRNQLGMAFLDGKTPCLLVARGTYTTMLVDAYQFHDGKLEKLWTWDNREESEGNWRGQGAHWMHSGDVDDDGRDEVILGSCVIDDDGKGLWTTGLGHPDKCMLTDVDPARPGLEIFYVIEPGKPENGVCLVDARTGEIIWGLQERSYHVGSGMAADIDPRLPGAECWASEDPKGDPKQEKYNGKPPRWIFSAKGGLIGKGDDALGTFTAVYWDADALRELCSGGRIMKHGGPLVAQGLEGGQILWGDIIGDWREEIITSVAGEMRVYTSTIPASDRRVCLLQDPIYRADIAHLAMGYSQPPCTTKLISQKGPAVWMKSSATTIRKAESVTVTAMLSAPADRAIEGTFRLSAPAGLTVAPATANVSAAAGGIAEAAFEVRLNDRPALLSGGTVYSLGLTLEGAESASASAALRAEEDMVRDVPMAQAEDFAGQGGGEVQIRDDKVGADGKALSHWDNDGHWLSWNVEVARAGAYLLIVRYCAPNAVKRLVQVGDMAAAEQTFGGTGGFGSSASDWMHAAVTGEDGEPLVMDLEVGSHSIKMTNADGQGMNIDYVALVPAVR